MEIVVILVGVAALVILVTIVNRMHGGASSADNDVDHPGWRGSAPDKFDEKRIAALSAYPGTYEFDIVGESHYQETLATLCGGTCEVGHAFDTDALLVPYCNAHDPHAVAVLMGECELVGHLKRIDARKLRIALKRIKLGGSSLKVPCRIVGGWKRRNGDEGHFGVKLDLPI